MIIYIHGFGSSGEGEKANVFRAYFESIGMDFMAPTLSHEPALAVTTLQSLIESCGDEVCLIGASLGGYYASYLSKAPRVKRVLLINPAVSPSQTLKRAIMKMPRVYDAAFHRWIDFQLESLESYRTCDPVGDDVMVLLQKGDAVLDYREAVERYDGARMRVEEGGSHGFERIERYFETIRAFFAAGDDSCLNTIECSSVSDKAAEGVQEPYTETLALFLDSLYEKIKKEPESS